MTQLATVEKNDAVTSLATPMEMLGQAINNGMDIGVIEKLMDLQERYEANIGRKAFDAAISAAKAEFTPVTRNKTGHQNKRYADFEAYAKMIDPIIAKHGLSYRFETEQNNTIIVSCIVSHDDGHSIRNSLAAPADTSGSKNSIQAIGSTLTYLQRYTLIQAFGLAATDDDDAAISGTGETINDDQLEVIRELIDAKGTDLPKFCKFFKIGALPHLPASQYERAVSMLRKKDA